jgi:hypothetical protein
MASDNELFHCRADLTNKDVVSTGANGQLKLNPMWTDKTKGKLRVYDDRLIFKNLFCKPQELLYADMCNCLLLTTKIAFVNCHVLWVVHREGQCGFSFLRNDYWDQPLPFHVERADAKTSHSVILGAFVKKLGTGFVGEVAGRAVSASSLASRVGGKLTSVVTAEVADNAVSTAGEQVKSLKSASKKIHKQARPSTSQADTHNRTKRAPTPPPLPDAKPLPEHRYVVKRDNRNSDGISKSLLIKVVERGELVPTDEVWDMQKGKRVNTQKLIAKYSTAGSQK